MYQQYVFMGGCDKMRTIIDIRDIVCFNSCSYCKISQKHCYVWYNCIGHLMEILAYNMVMVGDYYG